MQLHGVIDVKEEVLRSFIPSVLDTLLFDRSTRKNILWASDNYAELGAEYQADMQIHEEQISGVYTDLIQPRVAKSISVQDARTKASAEVFTPCWVCNEQNNLVDTQWFGRGDVFNRPDGQTWTATEERVEFPEKASLSWKKYVDARRLEISCGEAPYLVSRYDTVTGEFTDNKSSLTFDGWGAVFDARPIDAVIVLTPDLLGNNKRNSGINLLVKALRPEENDEMIGEVLDSIDACIEHRLKIFRTVEDRLKVRNV